MDEVHVADLADRRLAARSRRRARGCRPARPASQTSPSRSRLSSKRLLDADLPHGAARRSGRSGRRFQSRKTRRRRPRRSRCASWSRNARSENICASSDRSCRCCSVACSGTSSTNTCSTGLPSGASNGPAGAAARTRRAPRASPLMRPCGMAMPWPRPVEPSFSRAARLAATSPRRSPACARTASPTASNRLRLRSRRRGRARCWRPAAVRRSGSWIPDAHVIAGSNAKPAGRNRRLPALRCAAARHGFFARRIAPIRLYGVAAADPPPSTPGSRPPARSPRCRSDGPSAAPCASTPGDRAGGRRAESSKAARAATAVIMESAIRTATEPSCSLAHCGQAAVPARQFHLGPMTMCVPGIHESDRCVAPGLQHHHQRVDEPARQFGRCWRRRRRQSRAGIVTHFAAQGRLPRAWPGHRHSAVADHRLADALRHARLVAPVPLDAAGKPVQQLLVPRPRTRDQQHLQLLSELAQPRRTFREPADADTDSRRRFRDWNSAACEPAGIGERMRRAGQLVETFLEDNRDTRTCVARRARRRRPDSGRRRARSATDGQVGT